MPADTGRYVRISEDKPGDAHGVTNQDTATTDVCDRAGWTHVAYVDNDLSATKGKHRPGYARLVEDIKAGTIKRIVVFHLSRLWRNRVERAQGIEIMRRYGVSVHCAKGPSLDMSSAYGRGMTAMLGEMDTLEVELKAERHELAELERAKAGLPHAGGPRAWGYQPGGMHLDADEVPLVRTAFEMWVTGASLGEICRWLDDKGSRTPRGNRWGSTSMRSVLSNPRYAGLRGVRHVARDEHGVPALTESGEPRYERYHEIIGPAAWPRIVEQEVWRAGLARIQDPVRGQYYAGRERKYLLPGLGVCAVCELPLKAAVQVRARASRQRSIKCPSGRHVHRNAPPIERYVMDVVCWRLDLPDAHELLVAPASGVDVRALADEARAIRERLRAISADEVLGRRSRDEVAAARDAAAGRLAQIDGLVADAGRVDVVAQFVTGESPWVVWEQSSLSVQRRLVGALAVVRVGSGVPGRPARGWDGVPPNVWVQWRRPVQS